jgi:hypothetical protein
MFEWSYIRYAWRYRNGISATIYIPQQIVPLLCLQYDCLFARTVFCGTHRNVHTCLFMHCMSWLGIFLSFLCTSFVQQKV